MPEPVREELPRKLPVEGSRKKLLADFLDLKKRGPEKSLPTGWTFEVKPGTPA